MNNFLSSLPLFMDLLGRNTYATDTVKADYISLSTKLAKNHFI